MQKIYDLLCAKVEVSNLISNAIKFTEKGFVHLELTKDSESLISRVKYSGIGISEEKYRSDP